jgi:hypothetical protein
VNRIHADVDALHSLHGAMARFRLAGRSVADRGHDQIAVTRASLEAEASQCRSRLEQGYADLGACRQRAAESAATGNGPVDCSEQARAVSEAEERLERIWRWQYRVGQRPLLLPFFLLMIGNGIGEQNFGFRHLATVTRGTGAARAAAEARSCSSPARESRGPGHRDRTGVFSGRS